MQEVESLKLDKTAEGPIFKVFKKIASKPLLLAFLFNLTAFLLCILFFDIKYEVSDDYITDAVLSGAFGTGYDPKLLFGNVILGYILVFLYKLIPTVSFYFFLLIGLDFISATIILYLLFKEKVNAITVCMASIFLIFYSDDLYILIQFTKAATAAGIAGGLLILYGLWETEKHKIIYVVSGSLLMIIGSMVRTSTIYIFSAFLVLVFLFHAISRFQKTNNDTDNSNAKKQSNQILTGIGIRFGVCVVIIGTLFGLNYLGGWISSRDETHKDFNSFQSIRGSITDKTRPSFDLVEDEYRELGLDAVDYIMINSWNFVDSEVYSDELLQKVAAIHQNIVSDSGMPFSYVIETLLQRRQLIYPAALALYIFAGMYLALSKKRIYSFAIVLSSIALIIGFIYYGRTMYRVEWSVFYCAASCLLSGFSYNENSKFASLNKKILGKNINTMAFYMAILAALLLVSRISRIVEKYSLLNCSDQMYRLSFATSLEFSGEYVASKVSFPSVTRKLTPNLVDQMENDPDNYYIVDFATGIQDFYFNYEPWIRPEQGLFEKYSYYGGCTMRHPGERSALIANGADPDNPFKSLVNDNIYLVDNWGYEYKLAYYRKYFCPDAEIALVNEIDGYMIWKIYIPENAENSSDLAV